MLFTADAHGWTRFITMQNHYNLLYREEEREMIPLCLDQKIGVVPWSPLARGLLAGKRRSKTVRAKTDSYGHQLYGEQIGEADERVVDRLEEEARNAGVPPAQMALAWLLQKPAVAAPIVGISKAGQLTDALAALELDLSAEVAGRLEAPYLPHSVAGI
jgi:aryl-alcohol dehydrogenase-like predicted oxidoreductase